MFLYAQLWFETSETNQGQSLEKNRGRKWWKGEGKTKKNSEGNKTSKEINTWKTTANKNFKAGNETKQQ